jgi:hypothetical protein
MNPLTVFEKDFFGDIEKIVSGGVTYIDAIVHYAETHDLEVEYLAQLASKNPQLKSKIQREAENLNFIKKKTARIVI